MRLICRRASRTCYISAIIALLAGILFAIAMIACSDMQGISSADSAVNRDDSATDDTTSVNARERYYDAAYHTIDDTHYVPNTINIVTSHWIEGINLLGRIPTNYVGSVPFFSDAPQKGIYEVQSVEPSEWTDFIHVDADGHIAVEQDFYILERFFKLGTKNYDYTARIERLMKNTQPGVTLPDDIILKVGFRDEYGILHDEQQDIAVRFPQIAAVGNETCGPTGITKIEWFEGLGNDWTEEQAEAFWQDVCSKFSHSGQPQGITFSTTEADRQLLPDGLTQPKENYDIIFRDEFSTDGGTEQIDPRLWSYRGYRCAIKITDGVLRMTVNEGCTGGGILGTNKKFDYRYGYIEGRFPAIPYGYNETGQKTNFRFTSWPWRHDQEGGFHRFICRGSDAHQKRKLWLSTYGVEMQIFEGRSVDRTYSYAWWVYHIQHADHAAKTWCHDEDNIGIHSGVLWRTFIFTPDDNAVTVGVEWTPAGYRGFINGELYTGVTDNSNQYRIYGYGSGDEYNAWLYSWTSRNIPEDNIIPNTVSHAYHGIQTGIWRTDTLGQPDGDVYLEIDYIRVYQPRDKYATVEPSYD